MANYSLLRTCVGMLALCMAAVATAAGTDEKPAEAETITVTGISPTRVDEVSLQPGLQVLYYYDFFERDVRRLPEVRRGEYPTKAGPPVLEINHQFGDRDVFDSGVQRGIGMRMTGFLHFPETGVYEFQALSNDGIIMTLDGQTVVADPEQHSDRLSNIGAVTISEQGYYPVIITYFQRKGTAALKLFWKAPGSADFVPVPPSAYRHEPSE